MLTHLYLVLYYYKALFCTIVHSQKLSRLQPRFLRGETLGHRKPLSRFSRGLHGLANGLWIFMLFCKKSQELTSQYIECKRAGESKEARLLIVVALYCHANEISAISSTSFHLDILKRAIFEHIPSVACKWLYTSLAVVAVSSGLSSSLSLTTTTALS